MSNIRNVNSATTSAEPSAPADGDAYVFVGITPTGTNWASFAAEDLVVWRSAYGVWEADVLYAGKLCIATDTNTQYECNGTTWAASSRPRRPRFAASAAEALSTSTHPLR